MSRDQMLEGMYRRDEALNGRYIVGVTSTRIYCLPDCPARKPKADNVVFFLRERDAHDAGFRACKRCRPDNYYRGIDQDHGALTHLVERLRKDPAAFPNVRTFVRASGFGSTKLTSLCVDHFHQTPATLLRSLRVERACQLLTDHALSPTECCFAAGFGSLATFYQQFGAATGMAPAAYAGLPGKTVFTLTLPRGYSSRGMAALLGRDPLSTNQGFAGSHGFKAVSLAGVPARLTVEMRPANAHLRIEGRAALPPVASIEAHAIALRLLGLCQHRPSATVLQREPWATLVSSAAALRPALYTTAFEALLWAIVGQQINIRFAATLIRRINDLVGERIDASTVLPATPHALAELDRKDLAKLQCSGAKADTIIRVARAISRDELPIATLSTAGAAAARQRLVTLKGVGPWTSEYVLMRGMGFADCLPLGDSGLRNGVRKFFKLPQRPDSAEVASRMAAFAPYRSLATHHIWMSHSG